MEAASANAASVEHIAEPDKDDIGGWMRYFGVGPDDDDEA
jgi:hypothetical protein